MFLAPDLSVQEFSLLEYALARFVEQEENAERKTQLRRLHEKIRATVVTEETMTWDTAKLDEESPVL